MSVVIFKFRVFSSNYGARAGTTLFLIVVIYMVFMANIFDTIHIVVLVSQHKPHMPHTLSIGLRP